MSVQSWTDLSPTIPVSPSARDSVGLSYDSSTATTLLFGGGGAQNSSYVAFDQTWAFSEGTWSELQPASHPAGRVAPLMVNDPQVGGVLLWGGSSTSGVQENDTWKFVNGSWTEVFPTGGVAPPPGSSLAGAMTFDSTLGAPLLLVYVGNNSETWEYLGEQWLNLTPPASPGSSSYAPLLMDDPTDHGVLLVGGATVNETWLFSAGSWTHLLPAAALPSLVFPTGCFDPYLDAPVVAGGAGNGSSRPNQTWEFVNDNWSLVTSATLPSSVIHAAGAFDRSDGFLLLFGGEVSRPLSYFISNETWVLGPPLLAFPVVAPNPTDVGVNVTFTNPYAASVPGYVETWDLGDGNGSAQARFTHVYTSAGSYVVTLRASDGAGRYNNTTLTISVFARPTVALLAGPTPADAGTPMRLASEVTGGAPPLTYLWELGDGNRSVAPNLSYVYSLAGTYHITLTVSDGAGLNATANLALSVNSALRALLALSWPVDDLGQSLQIAASVQGGTPPFRWTYYGTPAGCSPGNVTDYSCTPSSVGKYDLTVAVTDARGGAALSAPYQLEVYAPLIVALSADQPAVDLGQPVNLSSTLTGGAPGPYALRYSGLPPGCAAPPGLLAWTCTPTAVGRYNLSLLANDTSSSPSASAALAFVVNAIPSLTFSASPANPVTAGDVVQLYANVTGGTPPYRYGYGGLPGGCSSASQSDLPCVPSSEGSYDVTVTVTDAVGVERIRNLTLVIGAPSVPTAPVPIPWFDIEMGALGGGTAIVAAFIFLRRQRILPPT